MKKSVKCNLCGKELSSQYYLNIHISGHHEGVRQIKCNLCDFKTYMKGDLTRHMRNHTGERPFRCTVNDCTLTFKDNGILKKHIKHKHSSERPFKCEFPSCMFTGKMSYTLRQHMKVHSDDRPFACPYTGCEYRAKFRMNVRQHVTSVHSEIKPFACSECEFKSARKVALDYHMACHLTTRDFKCSDPTCKKAFKRPLDLKRHFSNRHEIRNFHCDHRGCGRKYGSACALWKHERDCHSNKSLTCPESECNYNTNRARLLAQHMISHQRRNRMISCSIPGCTYKGKDSEAVEVHMRRHKTILACPETGCNQFIHPKKKLKDDDTLHKPSDRHFHCPLCFEHFRALSILKAHCVTHTHEKQFSCGYCHYASFKHFDIKNHVSSMHSNVQFPFIVHLQNFRECIRCKVTLPTAQFPTHSIAHAAPVVIMKRLEIKAP